MTKEFIDNKIEALEAEIDEMEMRLDNIEGCEDNEVYEEEVRTIRQCIANAKAEIEYLSTEEPEEIEFQLSVKISGKAWVDAMTLEEAKAKLYDAVKNHPKFVVEFVEIEED